MVPLVPARILYFVVLFILVQGSAQQELFEDAVKRENLGPALDTSLRSNVDEYGGELGADYNGPSVVPARDEEQNYEQDQEQEGGESERQAGYSIVGNDEARFSQEVPAFSEEDKDDEDEENEDKELKVPYKELGEIEEGATKRSHLGTKSKKGANKSKKGTKLNNLNHKKIKSLESMHKQKTSKKSPNVQKASIGKLEDKANSEIKQNESKYKIKKDNDNSGSGGEKKVSVDGNSSGREESSGAERERRQTFQTEEDVIKAREKLMNANEASDALTNIEREMGLDPATAPYRTKNLTHALRGEISKFQDILSLQNDGVKKSNFEKLEKLAEEDVKGTNDVMKLIVELEVAKFFAKHRARKKLELALRSKIINPPLSAESVAPMAGGLGPIEPYRDQGGMVDFRQQYQGQGINGPNMYASFADQSQVEPQSQPAPSMPFSSTIQTSAFAPAPSPFQPAPFQGAAYPPASFQQSAPPLSAASRVRNSFQGRYLDSNMPPRWNPQVAPFAPVQQAPQGYNPYLSNPMSYAPTNFMPETNLQPQNVPPKQQKVDKPSKDVTSDKAPKTNPKHKIKKKKYSKHAKTSTVKQQDDQAISKGEKQLQQDNNLPKSSPFSGLKPLEDLNPLKPSEMQSQTAPFSSYMNNPFATSSSHPYSDALTPPLPPPQRQNTQAFNGQASWTSPSSQVNRFSESMSHLNPHYQKPAVSFKPSSPSPPLNEGKRPHPPDLAKMLKTLAQYHSHPISAHQFRPMPAVQPQEPQRLQKPSPPKLQTPPMYPQFDFPAQGETAIPLQQPVSQFTQPAPQYFQPAPQNPQSFISPPPAMPAPLPLQSQAPPMQNADEQDDDMGNEEDEGDNDINAMDQEFNDEQSQQPGSPQYRGQAVYPQQQPMQQAYNGYNAYSGVSGNTNTFSWPQNPNYQLYGYQTAPSYKQLVNPLLIEALNKVQDTQKAAKIVQKIENTIGLSPPAVNHIISDVETETKERKKQFDQNIKNDEDEIQNDKNLIKNDVIANKEELQKRIDGEKNKLDEDKKRDDIAKAKLKTIRKIEKILTIIETAKFSALKRAKQHLMKLTTEKDPQIRKRDLETLERDLDESTNKNHIHRRNEINIWLKGSRNSINTSHFVEGKHKKTRKDLKKKKFNVFSSTPKLAMARISKLSKKSKINTPEDSSATQVDASGTVKGTKMKKPKIGIILMRKLLQRMDDLYAMQSKILTQLITDHQQVQDEKEKERSKRDAREKHRLSHRHHRHLHSK